MDLEKLTSPTPEWGIPSMFLAAMSRGGMAEDQLQPGLHLAVDVPDGAAEVSVHCRGARLDGL